MAKPNLNVERWICPNCGQIYFGDDPPDMCEYCRDFTTWQPAPPLRPDRILRRPEEDSQLDSFQPPLFD